MVSATKLKLQGPLIQSRDSAGVKHPHHLSYLQLLLRLRGMLEEEMGKLEA